MIGLRERSETAIPGGFSLMRFSFTSQTSDHGVAQQFFVLDPSPSPSPDPVLDSDPDRSDHSGGAIPGVLWTPDGASGSRPLVLLGHEGGQSKTAPGVLALARRLVGECGFAVAAIDAPGHGERPPTAEHARLIAPLRAAMGAGDPVGALVADINAAMARWTVPEWRVVLDALRELDHVGFGPVGYWGVSMGAAIGIPLAVAERRIAACVFGLAGAALTVAASRVAVPLEFLLQWDDEVVPRDEGLVLFDAFASAEKTLHANPGRHGEVPQFAGDSAVGFFARHLGAAKLGTANPGTANLGAAEPGTAKLDAATTMNAGQSAGG
jgi:dienelactone hydrolase